MIYNCPDCWDKGKPYFGNPCDNCFRNLNKKTNTYRINFNLDTITESCRGCYKHPTNGGDGICCCTLGSKAIY